MYWFPKFEIVWIRTEIKKCEIHFQRRRKSTCQLDKKLQSLYTTSNCHLLCRAWQLQLEHNTSLHENIEDDWTQLHSVEAEKWPSDKVSAQQRLLAMIYSMSQQPKIVAALRNSSTESCSPQTWHILETVCPSQLGSVTACRNRTSESCAPRFRYNLTRVRQPWLGSVTACRNRTSESCAPRFRYNLTRVRQPWLGSVTACRNRTSESCAPRFRHNLMRVHQPWLGSVTACQNREVSDWSLYYTKQKFAYIDQVPWVRRFFLL
jgi:hypothetical protein